MGYGIKAPNQPRFLYANISFKYVGLATTVALVHELTHVIFALSRLDIKRLESISLAEAKGKETARELFDATVGGGDGVLRQGFAEYISEQFNAFRKYNVFDDVDEDLRYHLRKKKITIENHTWPIWLKSSGREKSSLAYQLSHSYCRFLMDKFGKERFIRLLSTDAQDKAYRTILNVEKSRIMHD